MENRGFIVIQDWMLDLPLSLVETTIYALIYGFSQDGESAFSGSLGYIARKSKSSKDTARRAIRKLMEEGLVQQIQVNRNGVTFYDYKTCDLRGGIAKCNGGDSKMQPHNNINNKNNNITINKERRAFIPPTFTEVQNYCTERRNNVNADAFIAYYESNGWMVGKNKMKDWKAAVRTWEQRDNAKPVSRPRQEKKSNLARINEMMAQVMGGFADEQ